MCHKLIANTLSILLGLQVLSAVVCVPAPDGQSRPEVSPRQYNTKYGTLRGVIINMSRDTPAPTSSSSTSSSSTPNPTSQRTGSSTPGSSSPLQPVEAFYGVPYASPPIQTLRFMPPVTPPHWRGVRAANRPGPVCPQPMPDIHNGTDGWKVMSASRLDFLRRVLPYMRNQSEDCLYLNIYMPYNPMGGTSATGAGSSTSGSGSTSTSSSSRLSVIVFIGGESYDWDAGNPYDGSILASFGHVIVVTLNYRLGVLGFLPAVVDGAVRGNYGLMDQVAALHWVQENIGEFNGDPHNVTVIGHGFGASCVHLLMISPMARGLFARVVLMSGSALQPASIARDADTYARHLAKAINCPNFDNVVMVDCLRQKSVEDILRVDLMTPQHLTAFGPIIDGIVVPLEPRQLMLRRTGGETSSSSSTSGSGSSGGGSSSSSTPSQSSQQTFLLNSMASQRTVDLMFGVTRVETPFIFSGQEERHGIDLSRRERILRTLVRNLFDYHQQAILLTLINEYTDWNRPIEHPINLLDATADILGDALVVAPIVETGDLHTRWTSGAGTAGGGQSGHASGADNRPHKTFFYVFVYQSEDGNKLLHQRLGCMHGEELAYLFGAPLAVQLLGRPVGHFAANYSKPEVTLSEAVMTYWTNFAKYGDPNVGQASDSDGGPTQSGTDRKGRFDNVQWPQYDTLTKKYLMIGMKPKVRDHYHSHRLSFWLQLIPHLHRPGDEEVYLRHHLLHDHENARTYDGVVRQIAFKFLQPLPTTGTPYGTSGGTGPLLAPKRRPTTSLTSLLNKGVNDEGDNRVLSQDGSVGGVSVVEDDPTDARAAGSESKNSTATALSTTGSDTGYATALSVTIAIGCSLLILNMLIFAGVYYQLDRNAAKHRATDAAAMAAGGAPITDPKRTISIASAGHNHLLHHHHNNDDAEETTHMLSHSKQSPISTLLTGHYTAHDPSSSLYHNNNTNSLRRTSGGGAGGVTLTGGNVSYTKLARLSLESVPEQHHSQQQQQQCLPVPSHQCSMDYSYLTTGAGGVAGVGCGSCGDECPHVHQHQELELTSISPRAGDRPLISNQIKI